MYLAVSDELIGLWISDLISKVTGVKYVIFLVSGSWVTFIIDEDINFKFGTGIQLGELQVN